VRFSQPWRLGYKGLFSRESQSTFRGNVRPPSWASERKPSKKLVRSRSRVSFGKEPGRCLFLAWFNLRIDMFFRNVHWLSMDYMAFYPRGQNIFLMIFHTSAICTLIHFRIAKASVIFLRFILFSLFSQKNIPTNSTCCLCVCRPFLCFDNWTDLQNSR
jgi:hypothetical protein